ncbi:MAG: riboflavin synthase [Sinomicrobium sp.]|nr:riboflavin synthase [Sinomicrobium sp.]
MFTGIIESLGSVTGLKKEGDNLHISIKSALAPELKIDQSVAHNGVCLTVVAVNDKQYTVTAIKETLSRSNLGDLKTGDTVNLERAMKLGDRLDGHLVQGHVDTTGLCTDIEAQNGSWLFTFKHSPSKQNITIEKGSVTVDGVSLTVVKAYDDCFSVAVIPYTYTHTNFKNYSTGSRVNIEFDLVGKYIAKLTERG